jgi:glutaconate CoA-transferase, subunit A
MVKDFVQARRELRQKDRSVRDKLVSLPVAVGLVDDGSAVAVGGCLYSRTPMAGLLEIVRQGRRGLTLSRSLTCYEAELFFVRGTATALITSWVGIGLPWGIPKVFRHYIEEGLATYEEWSHLALGLRFKAAAMGVPFLPTLSMLGSDLMGSTTAMEMKDPFTGHTVCLVPAYYPDVALIHVQRADRLGNAQIDGPSYMDREIAAAARTVIITAEEIVPEELIAAHPEQTVIPHFVVDALVHAPFGSYPHECYGLYEADFQHFQSYVTRVNQSGRQGVEEYLAEYVDAAGSHEGLLERFGVKTLLRQRQRALELVPR